MNIQMLTFCRDNYAFVTYVYKCDAYAAVEGKIV